MLAAKQQRILALSILLAACLYALFIFSGNPQEILYTMGKLSISNWLMILACTLFSYLIRFYRWQGYMQYLRHNIPRALHLSYYLAGFALTTTPGKAGETIRSIYLKPHAVGYPDSLACFFSERLLDVIVICFFATLGLIHFPEYQPFFFLISSVLMLFLLLIYSGRMTSLFNYLQDKLPLTVLNHILNQLKMLFHNAHRLLRASMLIKGVALGLCAWFIQGLAFYFMLSMLDYPLDLTLSLAIFALSILAGAASFIPGGIGATEVVMGILLLASGSDQSLAVSVPILFRLSTLWFAVLVGLLANIWVSIQRQNTHNPT